MGGDISLPSVMMRGKHCDGRASCGPGWPRHLPCARTQRHVCKSYGGGSDTKLALRCRLQQTGLPPPWLACLAGSQAPRLQPAEQSALDCAALAHGRTWNASPHAVCRDLLVGQHHRGRKHAALVSKDGSRQHTCARLDPHTVASAASQARQSKANKQIQR